MASPLSLLVLCLAAAARPVGASASHSATASPVSHSLSNPLAAHRSLSVASSIHLISITPSSSSAEASRAPDVRPVELAGTTPITVTFSRAVIALGADFVDGRLPDDLTPFTLSPPVAGRLRWVTTSVARFDPAEEWPAELQIQLRLNPKMRSFDGLSLAATDVGSAVPAAHFHTPQLTMSPGSVFSDQASNVTDGGWTAEILGSTVLELPPDGRLELHFSSKIDIELVQAAMVLQTEGQPPRQVQLSSCSRPSSRCVIARVRDALSVGKQYLLVLPKSTRFHPRSGPLQDSIQVHLSGLLPFQFPFPQQGQQGHMQLGQIVYRRLQLWLRHGLEAETSLLTLSSFLRLKLKHTGATPLTFRLTHPKAHLLQLEAELQPETTYILSILSNNTIRDGFGLPLQAGSVEFTTSRLQDYYSQPGGEFAQAYRFPAGPLALPATWPALVRGKSLCYHHHRADCSRDYAQYSTFTAITAADVRHAIAALSSKQEMQGSGSQHSLIAPLENELQRLDFPLESALRRTASQILLHTFHGRFSISNTLISYGELGASAIAAPDGSYIFWVVNTTSNTPVGGASIELYSHSCYTCKPQDIRLRHTGQTDSSGVCRMYNITSNRAELFDALIKTNNVHHNEALLLDRLERPRTASTRNPVATIITDRSVYKANDTMYVTGYVREHSGAKLVALASGTQCKLRVNWIHGRTVTEVTTVIDEHLTDRISSNVQITPSPAAIGAMQNLGAFSVSMRIPPEAEYKKHLISLNCRKANRWRFLASESIVVADPRPPTVHLEANVAGEGFLRPGGAVELKVVTTTMTGLPVGYASIKLKWKLTRSDLVTTEAHQRLAADATSEDSSEDVGEEELLTDGDGVATMLWRPDNLTRPEAVGDTLSVDIEWFGPTRERLTKTLEIPVAINELLVSVEAPSQAELPEHMFDLRIGLRYLDILGGVAKPDVPIEVTLYEIPEDLTEPPVAHGDTWMANESPTALAFAQVDLGLDRCVVHSSASGVVTTLGCSLRLPRVGRFVAAACLLNHRGNRTLCTGRVLGRSKMQWLADPLTSYLDKAVDVTTDKTTYVIGDAPKLLLVNPLQSPLRALIVWGNRLKQRVHSSIAPISSGAQQLELPAIGEECSRGCELDVYLVASSNSSRSLLVDTSPLFDVALPMSSHHKLTLDVLPPPTELQVSIKLDADVAAPSTSTGFTVQLTDADGNPSRGQVVIVAVDKALLAVRPHPPRNLSALFVPSLNAGYRSHTSSYSELISARGIEFAARRLLDLQRRDPWLPMAWPVHASSSMVEMSIDQIMLQYTSALTDMPPIFGVLERFNEFDLMMGAADTFMAKSAPIMLIDSPAAGNAGGFVEERANMESSSVTSNQGRDAPQIKLRANFETTPLFLPAVPVGASGQVHVSWKLPDNTGAYELRAYAVSAENQFGGGGIVDQHVRKKLTLQASIPRIARVGDRFRCGFTVTASPEIPPGTLVIGSLRQSKPEAALPVAIRGNSSAPASGLSDVTMGGLATDQRHFAVSPGAVVELVFNVEAMALGEAVLIAEVRQLAGDAFDALELRLPVMGAQPAVQVATSRMLVASPKPSLWQEGMILPEAVDGKGTVTLQLGVGHLPSVLALANAMLELPTRTTDLTSPAVLASIAAAATLEPYPGAISARQRAASQLSLAANQLSGMHSATSGLHYSARARAWAMQQANPADQVDISLTAHALVTMRNLRLARVHLPTLLQTMESEWQTALKLGLIRQVQRAQEHGFEWADWETLALCRLALGRTWTAPAAAELSMEALISAVDKLSVFGKAAIALVLQLSADPTNDFGAQPTHPLNPNALAVLRYLASSLRVTGRTAYISATTTAGASAGRRANAIALSAFAFARKSYAEEAMFPNVDKLARHIAELGEVDGGLRSISFASAFEGWALRDYDESTKSMHANVSVAVYNGNRPLYARRVVSSSPSPNLFSVPWSQLPSPPAPLLFVVAGVGEVSAAVGLEFIPAHLPSQPIDRGIAVQKIIRRYSSRLRGPVGPPLASVELGSVVTVTIQVTTPDELTNLIIEDWLPSGLEAIDPNANGEESTQDERHWYQWWWRSTFERQTRKHTVSYYSSWAHAGTHTLEYEAIAVTRGAFQLPPTKAAAALEPEVMGLSVGGMLQIVNQVAKPELTVPTETLHSLFQSSCEASQSTCQCYKNCSVPTFSGTLEGTHISVLSNESTSFDVLTGGLPISSPLVTLMMENSHQLAFTYALSDHEEALPWDALHLSFTSDAHLALSIDALPKAHHTKCVHVMLAASYDGVDFGSCLLTFRLLASNASHSENEIWCDGGQVWRTPPSMPTSAASGTLHAIVLGSSIAIACLALFTLHWYKRRSVTRWFRHNEQSDPNLHGAQLQKNTVPTTSPPEMYADHDGYDIGKSMPTC